MWKREHRIIVDKGVTAEQIWKVWSNIYNWPLYDKELESVTADENFKFLPGNWFYLKVKGGPKVKIIITEVTANKTFTDYTQFPLARMYDTHELKQTSEGLQLINTMTVKGPLAWLWRKVIAEKVAAGIPEQTKNLIAMARKQ